MAAPPNNELFMIFVHKRWMERQTGRKNDIQRWVPHLKMIKCCTHQRNIFGYEPSLTIIKKQPGSTINLKIISVEHVFQVSEMFG